MKEYRFYGIGKQIGYAHVDFVSESDEEAINKSAIEFIKKYSNILNKVSLRQDNRIVDGFKHPIFMGYKTQKTIAQLTMWGYKSSFKDYSEAIRELCEDNLITTEISDEHIKYLYTNFVANLCGDCLNIKIHTCALALVNFISKVYDGNDKANEYLHKEYVRIAGLYTKKILKQYKENKINIVEEEDYSGRFLKTKYFKVYVKGDKLSDNIQLYHNDTYLCTESVNSILS